MFKLLARLGACFVFLLRLTPHLAFFTLRLSLPLPRPPSSHPFDPPVHSLLTLGSKPGEVKMVRNGDTVEAHQVGLPVAESLCRLRC